MFSSVLGPVRFQRSVRIVLQTSAEWVDREDIRRLVATAVRVGFVLDGMAPRDSALSNLVLSCYAVYSFICYSGTDISTEM
jgi:hypothetical protein